MIQNLKEFKLTKIFNKIESIILKIEKHVKRIDYDL